METNYKVLMTLMGLEIGGAETHVLELCKALRQKGLKVYVASNGGAYEKELEEWGIIHFKVPLHNKNMLNLFTAYTALKKIIKENDIKLVHAHARIPAFLCGILQKKLNFRFVTTAHWIFSTAFPFNILTNWGEKSLSVSEDIKQYLIKNYNIPEENIIVTINGIDIAKFSKDIDYSDLLEEFSIRENSTKIVYISRMDKDRSLIAHKLIESLEFLEGDLQVIIVGGGDDFEKVKSEAKEMNHKLGEKIIILTNSRVDVNKFVALSDIFVGVSRSALEAMAGEKPVIVAGNEGYMGIFDKDTLDIGISTNFCCRGCEDSTTKILTKDLKLLLSKTPEELKDLGTFAREIIKQNYSVERMAADAIKLYEDVRYSSKPIDVTISGYYGFNNNGDDAVLKSITDGLKEQNPNLKITVLSKTPKETQKQYDTNSISRFNFFKVCKTLKNTNLLIMGGGTLLQDLTSTQSLIYYLWVLNSAHRYATKIMLYANGIGPVRKEYNKNRMNKTLQYIDLITLRDEKSAEVLKGFNINPNTEVYVTADAAFSLKKISKDESNIIKKDLGIDIFDYFIVAIRSWKYLSKGFEEHIAGFADEIQNRYSLKPIFISMQPENDMEISKKIISLMKTKGLYLEGTFSTSQYMGIISSATFTLAMRLHTIIYAAKASVPCIGLVYDPKVQAMMEMMGQNFYMNLESCTKDDLLSFAENIIENKEKISEEIENKLQDIQNRSFKNVELATKLLYSPEF